MKRASRIGLSLLLVSVCLGLLTPRKALAQEHAKLVDLYGSVLMGGTVGRGTDGGTPDFFHQSQGGAAGVNVGVRLIFLDLSIRFLQMFDGAGRAGTLSTVMLGPALEIPVVGGGKDVHGRVRPVQVVVRPGLAAGFGFGTDAPVKPPLTNDQLAAKGLLLMGRFGIERLFGPVLGIGAEVQGGYHYLFGASGLTSDHSEGWQLAGFANVSLHLGI